MNSFTRLLRYIALFAMTVTVFQTTHAYKVYFDNSGSKWDKVCTWIWDANDGNKNYTGGKWPGQEMDYDSKLNLYSFSFTCTNSNPDLKCIFNPGGDNGKTGDLDLKDNHVYNSEGDTGKTLDEYLPDPSKPVYVYVNNDDHWDEPLYAYVYNNDGDNGIWPGVLMTLDPTTNLWYYEIPEQFRTDGLVMINDNKTNQYPGAQQPGLALNGKSMLLTLKNKKWEEYTPAAPDLPEPGKLIDYKVYFYNNIGWNPINISIIGNAPDQSQGGTMMSPLNSSLFQFEFQAPENYTLQCRFSSGSDTSGMFQLVNNHVYTLSGDKGDASTFDSSTLLPEAEYWIEPAVATQNDAVTLYYNRGYSSSSPLKNTDDIYVWLGANKVNHTIEGWDYDPSCDWKDIDDRYKMTKVASQTDLYSISLAPSIQEWLGVGADERLGQLAFLFRDKDGSKKTDDYFIDLQPLPDPSLTLGAYTGYEISNGMVTVTATDGTLYLTPLSPDVIKVFTLRNSWKNAQERRSISVVPTDSEDFALTLPDDISGDLTDSYLSILIDGSERLRIDRASMQITFLDDNGDVSLKELNGLVNSQGKIEVSFQAMGDKGFYGGGYNGNHTNIQNLGALRMTNTQTGGWEQGTSAPHNICIPFYVSTQGYGVYFDDHYRGAQMKPTSTGSIYTSGSQNPIAYYYIGGGTMEKVMQNYTKLTGLQELPPYWALGYITSRFGYENRAEATNAITGIKNINIPLDGIVFDIQWQGGVSSMGKIDWNTSNFNDPQGMMKEFKDLYNVHSIAITEPYFTSNSGNYSTMQQQGFLSDQNVNGMEWLKSQYVGLIDVTNPRAMDWFGQLYKSRTSEGIDSWWLDLGEPEKHDSDSRYYDGSSFEQIHNEYGQLWIAATHQTLKAYDPNTRRIILPRAGTAGMQRYNTFPWTGDIKRSWNGLKAQVPALINGAMSGVSYLGSDIGGFGQTNGSYDQYTYLRWVQLGVFYPMMRTHADYYNNRWEPEPYSDYYNQVRDNVRKAINLRYAYLPYTYSQSYAYTAEGTPIARPANFNDPESSALSNIIDAYYWGPDVYVAPMLSSGETRSITFPSGDWLDMNDFNTIYQGATGSYPASYDKLPHFMRRGSFVTRYTQDTFTSTAEITTNKLTVHHFPSYNTGLTGSDFYDDDHADVNAIKNGNYVVTHFEGNALKDSGTNDHVVVHINREGNGWSGMYDSQEIMLQIHDIFNYSVTNGAVKLFCYGQVPSYGSSYSKAPAKEENFENRLEAASSQTNLENSSQSCYYYDSADKTLYVKLSDLSPLNNYGVVVANNNIFTGIEEGINLEAMTLAYGSGCFTYSALEGTQDLTLGIYSMTGMCVAELHDLIADGYAQTLDVDLQQGIYIARLSGRDADGRTATKTLKVIVR